MGKVGKSLQVGEGWEGGKMGGRMDGWMDDPCMIPAFLTHIYPRKTRLTLTQTSISLLSCLYTIARCKITLLFFLFKIWAIYLK